MPTFSDSLVDSGLGAGVPALPARCTSAGRVDTWRGSGAPPAAWPPEVHALVSASPAATTRQTAHVLDLPNIVSPDWGAQERRNLGRCWGMANFSATVTRPVNATPITPATTTPAYIVAGSNTWERWKIR